MTRSREGASHATQPVTVSFDEVTFTLTLTAPVGAVVQIVSGCVSDEGLAAVVHCSVSGLSSPPTLTVVFTTVPVGARPETIPLSVGCHNVTLTWPAGTLIDDIAAAVTPPSALDGIWRFDSVDQRFHGYFLYRGAPNDLASVNGADEAFICVRAPATLARPAM